jgi:hypothetical protein
MRKVSIQIVALALSVLFAACDSNVKGEFKNQLLGPSSGVAIVSFAPPTIVLSPVGTFACPGVAPFVTSFNLIVDGRATGDLFLDAVGFRFIDGSSIGRTPLFSWFTAPELNSRFGQTLIVGGTTRAFAFAPQFGCDPFRPQTVFADVTLRDRNGAQQQMSVSSPIR